MNGVLISTGTALFIGLATITSAVSAEKGGGGGGGGGFSHGGGGGGGAGFSHGGGGSGGGVAGSMARGGSFSASGGGFSAAARGGSVNGNAGNFNGGNTMSFRGDSRMGRMEQDHDRGRDHGRFRGPGFAFGYYPGYDYNTYDYNDGCYQLREVPTRYGWRWRRVWVCD
jgi:hypothetical protein